MAAVEIRGTLYDLQSKSARQVYIVGEAGLAGLSIGYPLPQPPAGGGPGDPPHIWGPTDPRPTPPIAGIPGLPGYNPPPVDPPVEGGEKPPPAGQAGWGFYDGRWGYFPGPHDAQPK